MESSGTALARGYYERVVGPLLAARWPGLPHAAGRLGSGSDVLGFDDAMSRDHDWGLRLTLLVAPGDVGQVDAYLEEVLPATFAGLPARFATTWDPAVRHRVQVDTPERFATSRLGVDPADAWGAAEWLSLTGQAVLEVTAGPVFTDTHGGITEIRRRLAWYPDDLWRHVVAAGWHRIGRELPLTGRAGLLGDDLGSRVLAGRIAAAAMHLGFLLERRWPPYPKWLGTAFARLPVGGPVTPALRDAVRAPTWQQRQAALSAALDALLLAQHRAALPGAPAATEPFFDRPFRTVPAGVVAALRAGIQDPHISGLPPDLGSLEQLLGYGDVLLQPERRLAAVRAVLPAPPQERPR